MDTSIRVLGVLMVVVAVSGCVNNSQEDGNTTLQVPVGENAWGEAKTVNITDSLDPAEVSLTKSETLVWVNKNDFNVTVRIRGTDKEFLILTGERQSFRSGSGFEYEALAEDEALGSGKVVVRLDN